MKITIASLAILLIGVSVGFYLDHSTLQKKNDEQLALITKMQSAGVKQDKAIKTLITCVNITEKTYQQTQKYSSLSSCIKSRSGI
jgi:hypothetical protein